MMGRVRKTKKAKPATNDDNRAIDEHEKKVKSISPPSDPETEAIDVEDLPDPGELPDYDQKFKPIQQYITECDPAVEWPHIEQWLNRQPKTTEDALLLLNEQPNIMVRAERLFLLSKREYVKFEVDWNDRTSILRDYARKFWEREKSKGMRKQITNDMIEDWIIDNYGDAYRDMKIRLRDMKNTVKLLEKLSNQVENREPSLRRIVERMDNRKAPGYLTPKTTKGTSHNGR